jgi:hypothetical protein
VGWLVSQREWSWLILAVALLYGGFKIALVISGRPVLDPLDALVNAMVSIVVFIAAAVAIVKIAPHNATLLTDDEYKAAPWSDKLLDVVSTNVPWFWLVIIFWILK